MVFSFFLFLFSIPLISKKKEIYIYIYIYKRILKYRNGEIIEKNLKRDFVILIISFEMKYYETGFNYLDRV